MFTTKNKTKIYKSVLDKFRIAKKRHKYADIHLSNIKRDRDDIELDVSRLWHVLESALRLTQGNKDVVQIHKSDLEVLRRAAATHYTLGEVVFNCLNDEIKQNQ